MPENTLPSEDERLRDLGVYDLARGVGGLIELVSDVFTHLGSAVSQPGTPAARPINATPPLAPGPRVAQAADEPRAERAAEGTRQRGDVRRDARTYDDIGGLHREVRRLREMVELPLRFPELFARLGIQPPKGVLLHGPPGCGKTLIARVVAHETSARFFHVAGPEIIDQWYGASEAHLRRIFESAARQAPAIIFLDEVDAIAPKREQMSGERQAERRLVAQLLTLMDGLEPRGNVVVIAATNIPDTLDPALRRPGRFDRELAIGVPDRTGRREILNIFTRAMPLGDDVDLDALAAQTHGFVGADLEALCREAGMSALRRALEGSEPAQRQIASGSPPELHVRSDDFQAAQHEVSPSALRALAVEIPEVSWDDIGGLDDIKRLLVETVEWPLRDPHLFARLGVRSARGVLLHGAPGVGKTLLARALAHESQANFIAVRGPQLFSMYLGETERAVRELFTRAREVAPCVIFFDELDALAPARGMADSQTAERVVAQLLTEIDGIQGLNGVVVVAATNRPELIDPALLRPGRFDMLVALPPPDGEARLAILRVHTRGMPLAADVDLAQIAATTQALTGADLEALCRRAALGAAREELAARIEGPRHSAEAELANLRVAARHFDGARRELAAERQVLAQDA